MARLLIKEVTKQYQTESATVQALNGINLEAQDGELIALMGRSGCGKSTLLNVAGAMDLPTSGTVSIDGQVTSQLSDTALTRLRRQKVGFIFQSFQLLHTLSVIENVELPLMLAGHPHARTAAAARLEWVEMHHYASRLPHQLSGGQQQRVAIARALALEPSLVLADEPTGNLDSTTTTVILELLTRIARELHTTVLMATHSLESASISHRVLRLRDGRIE